MITLQSTLAEVSRSGYDVLGTCAAGHDYVLDLARLTDVATPFARLDDVLLTRSWCPICGQLAVDFAFVPPDPS